MSIETKLDKKKAKLNRWLMVLNWPCHGLISSLSAYQMTVVVDCGCGCVVHGRQTSTCPSHLARPYTIKVSNLYILPEHPQEHICVFWVLWSGFIHFKPPIVVEWIPWTHEADRVHRWRSENQGPIFGLFAVHAHV